MTNSQIEVVAAKLNDTIKFLTVLNTEALVLAEKERQQNTTKELLLKKEAAINQKEAYVKKVLSDVEVKKIDLDNERVKMNDSIRGQSLKEATLNDKLREIERLQNELSIKKTELEVFKSDLEIREKQLSVKIQDIEIREAVIVKEQQIDRERKMRLDVLEKDLLNKQEKIQKLYKV